MAHNEYEPEHGYSDDGREIEYVLAPESMTWDQHHKEAQRRGGHLACIPTRKVNDAVRRVAGGRTVFIGCQRTGPLSYYPNSTCCSSTTSNLVCCPLILPLTCCLNTCCDLSGPNSWAWTDGQPFEFTNWAVVEGWPSSIVAIDIIWGVLLTTLVAVSGRLAAGPPPEAQGSAGA